MKDKLSKKVIELIFELAKEQVLLERQNEKEKGR